MSVDTALFQPIRINQLNVRNRIVLGPMAVLAPDPGGRPSEQMSAFLVERAKGGVGMIIVGGLSGTARAYDETPFSGSVVRLDLEDYLPDLKRVADAVHAYKVPLIAEVLTSFGRMGAPRPDRPIIAASPINVVIPQDRFPQGIIVPGGRATPLPREATIAEISALERETATSAVRMQRAGWDGVEIAAHMSYFVASFLSPRTNWRNDEYGGSVENRARILVNIVRMIRTEAGPDFPIGLRITCNEHIEGGQGPEGYATIAQIVEREGIDYVALSDGAYETMDISTPAQDGGLIAHGEAQIFRRMLSVPLLLQGLHDPLNAADAVAAGHGDMVMLARPMLADPDYANKVRAGQLDRIVRCNRDNYCIRRLTMNMPMRCTVNPRAGRESRGSGKAPPIARFARAPLEWLILGLTGSRMLMGVAGKLAARKRKADMTKSA
ncbi:MAG TPA: NADH:flavin oxidoreductase [Sphingomonas sp.]|nr:NADH:flavin oxidoreductase [Sphingomonas sp.]